MQSFENGSDAGGPSNEELDARRVIRSGLEDEYFLGGADELPLADEDMLEAELGATGARNEFVPPFLLERIADRAARVLGEEGLSDGDKLDGETFRVLCIELGQSHRSEQAVAALEDLLFGIAEQDYLSRNLGDSITVDDLIEEGEKFDDPEDFTRFQQEQNDDAYAQLQKIITDQILDFPQLKREKEKVGDELKELKARLTRARNGTTQLRSIEEFALNERVEADLEEKIDTKDKELKRFEWEIGSVAPVGEVQERRDRTVRRLAWLIQQDYMLPVLEQLRQLKEDGAPMNLQDSVQMIVEGVEEIIRTHEQDGLDISTATAKDRRRYEINGARLAQAKAICDNIFQPDLDEHIYDEQPIAPSDFKVLQFIRTRLYEGHSQHLSELTTFLPGSVSRDVAADLANEQLIKFGGRSRNSFIDDIDSSIEDDPDMDDERIRELVRRKRHDWLSDEEELELAEYSLMVAERLVYKYRYPLGMILEK